MRKIDEEIKKLTIAHRLVENWLRLHPTAYRDCGYIGHKWSTYHNQRAELMNKVEDETGYVVEFDKETLEALLIDRKYYLDHFDEMWEKFH